MSTRARARYTGYWFPAEIISHAEFFDWYNLRRPHQALGWRTPTGLTSANQWL
jgi:transposase InsO family protein